MKKIILFALFVFFQIGFSFSQKVYTNYFNSYVHESYNIEIYDKGNDKYDLYINAFSFDNMTKNGGFLISNKRLPDFLNVLDSALVKYIEWTNIAKKNKVTDLKKPMGYTCKVDGYFEYGKWQFDSNIQIGVDFLILDVNDSIRYILSITTGNLVSSSNEFIKSDGFVLLFTSVEEINNFRIMILPDNISVFLKKPKSEDLFK